jgi:predicted secreted protein
VTISAAALSGTGFTDSGAAFPVTLNPSQSVTLQVKFNPTTTGGAAGQLTISSNSSTGATTNIQLSGTGTVATTPQLTVGANSLPFGNVTVNSSATLPVTLTSSGTAPVTISAAALSGTGFTDSGATFPVTLNPSQSVTLQVKFNPTTAVAASGQLTISSNSSTGASTMVQLSGTGTAAATTPQLLFSSTALPFGSVPVGSTATLSLTLTSTGTAAVTISSATLKGTGFSDSGAAFPVTLNPNQSVTLKVQFDPTATGAVAGTLTVSSNSTTGGTTQVTLSGTGTAVQHEIDLSWNAPSSSADPVAGYNVYRSADGGGSFAKLNPSPDGQVDYTDSAIQSGTTYMYEVKSVDANGVESDASNQISLTVP